MKRLAIGVLAAWSCSNATAPSSASILVTGSGGAYGDQWQAYDSLSPGTWKTGWETVGPSGHYCFHPPPSTTSVILLDVSAAPGVGVVDEGFVHLSANAEHWMTDGSVNISGYIIFTSGPAC